jgi:hypothetical protein
MYTEYDVEQVMERGKKVCEVLSGLQIGQALNVLESVVGFTLSKIPADQREKAVRALAINLMAGLKVESKP